ncbi:MAG TPA: hypothetical protein VHY09_07575, partial [Candidatus Methylacidiphilales bacterium]|nr:hypothetical protein [Candidatus Methylacidiphilales bacterium]
MTAMPPDVREKRVQAPLPKRDGGLDERVKRAGYLVCAILLHLVVFSLIATWVVFRAIQPPEDATTFHAIKIPTPPQQPPAPAGGESANAMEPTVDNTPPTSTPTVISTPVSVSFTVNAAKPTLPNLPAAVSVPTGSALAGHDTSGDAHGSGSVFGTEEGSASSQFEGYLYDLKQTDDRKPTGMDPGGYHNKIAQFIANDWDPGVLRPYYKANKALHTSSIFIPIIDANDGPRDFGVQNEVQPRMYCVWYKVTAAPPEDGTYHFVGTADDIMLVRVNHHTVLDGSDRTVDKAVRDKQTSFNMTNFDPTFGPNGDFWIGTPFHVSAHESVDIEVLIGEEPGGKSDYFLFI